MKHLEKISNNIIKIIFIVITFILLICSIFSTAYMEKNEQTLYRSDNFLLNICCIVLFSIVVAIFKYKLKNKIDKSKINKKIAVIGIVIWLIMCIIWILSTQFYPRADQKNILDIAKQMKEHNFNAFEKGGYMFKNPHQAGILLYVYCVTLIFGSNSYLVLQILNVLFLLLAFYSIYQTTQILYNNKKKSKCTLLGLLAFIPISFYITFIYGNIPGFALSMLAIHLEMLYLKNEKKKYIMLMGISIGIAILFKSNYLITLIAMVLLLILKLISNKKNKYCIPIIVIVISYLIFGHGSKLILKTISGKELDKGTPMISYIAMGIQEGKRAPGWYNEYTQKIYKKNGYDQEKTSEKIKKDIKESIDKMKNNPKYAYNFFALKTVSQWNNPSFQAYWINLKRESNIPENIVKKEVLGKGKISKIITEYMNIIQSLILTGALAYIILDYKKIDLKQLIFAIIFIGGFIFHLIWEAKGQYTITYFILLIPYAIMGYSKISNRLIIFYKTNVKKLKYNE